MMWVVLGLLPSLHGVHKARGVNASLARLVYCLPTMMLFLAMPLYVHRESIIMRAFLAAQFSWWANFKLLGFCCNRGPLSKCTHSTLAFFAVLVLPMSPEDDVGRQSKHSSINTAQFFRYLIKVSIKILALALIVRIVRIESLPDSLKHLGYAFGLYALIGAIEDGIGALSASILGISVERSFNKPYLSSSLRDFWANRWNQHVAKLLKAVIYEPIIEGAMIRKENTKRKGTLLRMILGTFFTFFTSGIMHEIVFFYIAESFAGDWLLFFTLQSVFCTLEYLGKSFFKSLKWLQSPPEWAQCLLSVSFLFASAELHFFPPVERHGLDKMVVNNIYQSLPFQKI